MNHVFPILYLCKVNFIGEGGIDHGGPRREFFLILAHEAAVSYMRGGDGDKYMAPNVTALQVFTCTLVCIYVEITPMKYFFVLESCLLQAWSVYCDVNCAGRMWTAMLVQALFQLFSQRKVYWNIQPCPSE